jgi:hypothetical protein
VIGCLLPELPALGLIRRPSTPENERKRAVVADTVVVRMIEESLDDPFPDYDTEPVVAFSAT